jgi:hypothetical protein
MKEVKILFASYLLDTLVSEINESGVERYLILSRITGQWRKDLRHFDNHVWPGTDSMLLLIVEDELAQEIVSVIRTIKDDLSDRIALAVIVTPIDAVVF